MELLKTKGKNVLMPQGDVAKSEISPRKDASNIHHFMRRINNPGEHNEFLEQVTSKLRKIIRLIRLGTDGRQPGNPKKYVFLS